MTAFGLAIVAASRQLALGTVERMGPGFFPLCLGAILALIGLAILFTPSPGAAQRPQVAHSSYGFDRRGWACIIGGLAAFVLLGKYLGLAPATFAVVFISALGDRANSLRSAFLLAAAMVVVAAVVFSWALQIQLPLLHWG